MHLKPFGAVTGAILIIFAFAIDMTQLVLGLFASALIGAGPVLGPVILPLVGEHYAGLFGAIVGGVASFFASPLLAALGTGIALALALAINIAGPPLVGGIAHLTLYLVAKLHGASFMQAGRFIATFTVAVFEYIPIPGLSLLPFWTIFSIFLVWSVNKEAKKEAQERYNKKRAAAQQLQEKNDYEKGLIEQVA